MERRLPWNGLGANVNNVNTVEQLLRQSNLDWQVKQQPIYINDDNNYIKIPRYYANIRSDCGIVLGIVTDRYQVIQNQEAFAFTEYLLGEGLEYESAGIIKNGQKVWITAKFPEIKILDDKFRPYIVFVNTHDGSSPVKIIITPTRMICLNVLAIATERAYRTWTIKHVGDTNKKLKEAQQTLKFVTMYMQELNNLAEIIVKKKINENKVKELLNNILPIKKDHKENEIKTINQTKEDILYRYNNSPDIKKYYNTGWGFINAIAEYYTHKTPTRKTKNYQERHFEKLWNNNNLLTKAVELLLVA